MAIETVLSTYITNRDAVPRVPNDLRMAGRSFTKMAFVHVAVADVASVYKMFDLPSNAVLTSMTMTTSADMGTTTTFKIGFYRTTMDGGAAVSDAAVGALIVTNVGQIVKKQLLFDTTYSTLFTPAKALSRIWEVLALATDPQVDYDVVMKTDGAADGAADVLLECTYKLV